MQQELSTSSLTCVDRFTRVKRAHGKWVVVTMRGWCRYLGNNGLHGDGSGSLGGFEETLGDVTHNNGLLELDDDG